MEIGFDIKTGGLDDLEPKFKQSLKSVVESVANLILDKLKYYTPVDTGALLQAWTFVKAGDHLNYTFQNPMSYAELIEFGLYSSVGPNTVRNAGGIYSSQAPYGMTYPVTQDKKLIEDIKGILFSKLEQANL